VSQQHTHILHTNADADHVSLIVQTGGSDARWHRVLNVLWDEGVMASLSDRAFRVFGAFLRLRQESGEAFATIGQLQVLTGYAPRNLYYARSELTEHPRRLLADQGSDRYIVLPGWSFAGRTGVQKDCTPVHRNCTPVQSTCAPYREARARQTNQPKTETETQTKRPILEPSAKAVVGWPDLDLFGQRAFNAGDVAGLLRHLGVWNYLAEPLAGSGAISVDRVMREAAGVAVDRTAGNKPLCLAKRLARSFGIELPKPPKTQQLMAEGKASGMESIARLRILAMQRLAAQSAPRGPSAAEYAQQEDE